MTKDDQLVVMQRSLRWHHGCGRAFPLAGPARDGRYYVVDFTLDEVRACGDDRAVPAGGRRAVPVYPARFPLWKSSFKIHTFQEEIEMIQGLEQEHRQEHRYLPGDKKPLVVPPPRGQGHLQGRC